MASRPTVSLIGAKARMAITLGVRAIGIPVSKTFGPQGRNALLFRTYNRGSRITNDGYTVAECQIPKNVFVRLAADTFREACKRTNVKVGDGTTGTVILGWKLWEKVFAMLSDTQSTFTNKQSGKIGVMTLKKQILESADNVKKEIRKLAKKTDTLEDLEKIAIVSVEDVELGKTIAAMAREVGVDGFLDVVEGYKGEIETEVIKGMRFPAKPASKAFINNLARFEMVAQDCEVIVTNHTLDNAAELGPIYTRLNNFTSKIITITPSFSDNVLVNMVAATKDGYFQYPVAVPSLRTEQLEDLAIYCGAKFIDKNKGMSLRSIQPEDLGFLEKLVVKDSEAREDAVATGGKGAIVGEIAEWQTQDNKDGKGPRKVKVKVTRSTSPLSERIDMLKGQLTETRQDVQKKILERRIASMGSAVGIIRVGDSTDASALYRKLKIEDCVYACKAALRGGHVEGGGLCLKKISEGLADDDILKDVLMAPYEQIQNSIDGGVKIGKNIIDPADAIYYAVEHATSVVSNLATVETLTPEYEDPIHGEGEMEIARQIATFNRIQRKVQNVTEENREEMEKDSMIQSFGVDNVDDLLFTDNG